MGVFDWLRDLFSPRRGGAFVAVNCPALPENAAEKALTMLKGMPGHMHASMLDDLNRGKRLELNDLSGEVVRLGQEHGIATPTHEMAWRALHPYLDGQPAG